jgi:epoxyqueuosine reductase
MDARKTAIRQHARAMGFLLCGFSTALPPRDFPLYEAWIAEGRHAGMAWLATDRARAARSDPSRLLPSARSIIALGTPYPPPQDPAGDPLEGYVAAYALGDDYHDVLKTRLRRLCAYLDTLAGRALRHRAYVDTGPVLEREIASHAGLGWIGRNSMLIHPAIGSFFFLSEVITELELEPDPPFTADRCGSCTRCIDACPAGCILPDRTIDSRRCVSYLTIEHRGSIAPELRGAIGRRIFGCDACQTVCPWNRNAPAAEDPAFLPRTHFPIRRLTAEYRLSESEWEDRFRRSALRRTGRGGYLRNLIVALGNSRRDEAGTVLRAARAGPDPVLGEAAAWSLAQISEKKR